MAVPVHIFWLRNFSHLITERLFLFNVLVTLDDIIFSVSTGCSALSGANFRVILRQSLLQGTSCLTSEGRTIN
jgi:hypothetical protein